LSQNLRALFKVSKIISASFLIIQIALSFMFYFLLR
jgi:hypothetical protein